MKTHLLILISFILNVLRVFFILLMLLLVVGVGVLFWGQYDRGWLVLDEGHAVVKMLVVSPLVILFLVLVMYSIAVKVIGNWIQLLRALKNEVCKVYVD